MYLAFVLLIMSVVLGLAMTRFFASDEEFLTFFLVSVVIGISLTTILGYWWLTFIKFSLFSFLFFIILLTLLLLFIAKPPKSFPIVRFDRFNLTLFIFFLVFSYLLESRLLFQSFDGLRTSIPNAYGDIGWHMASITSLSVQPAYPPVNPIMADHQMIYPFMFNYFSALLLRFGFSYSQIIIVPGTLMLTAALTLYAILVRRLTRSRLAAVMALLFLLMSGSSFGWLRVFDEMRNANTSPIDFFLRLPVDFAGSSLDQDRLFMPNAFSALLLPQRTMMSGLALVTTVCLLLIDQNRRGKQFLAGLLVGLLPLFHVHSSIALLPLLVLLILFKQIRPSYEFFLGLIPFGLFSVGYFFNDTSATTHVINWHPGWLTTEGESLIIFWLRNSGLLLPITFLALMFVADKALRAFAAAGLVLFLIANLWRFATWDWDNTKIFIYWQLFTWPLVAALAVRLLRRYSPWWSAVVVALVIFHTGSGFLSVLQLLSPVAPSWVVWNKDQLSFADMVRLNTRPSDTVLAYPTFNSTIALSGRSLYLGYPAHVWSHGGNPWVREAAIKPFYEGQIAILPEHQPDYILVGSAEKTNYPNLVIRPNWQLIVSQSDYRLYRLIP